MHVIILHVHTLALQASPMFAESLIFQVKAILIVHKCAGNRARVTRFQRRRANQLYGYYVFEDGTGEDESEVKSSEEACMTGRE